MHIFELPPELVQIIFEHIVMSRRFERVMRIRTVNRQFKTYIDYSIFRLRLLSQLLGPPYRLENLSWRRRHLRRFVPYVSSYLTYQAVRDDIPTSSLSRISRAAKALCEEDGNRENETVLACTDSLVRLAMAVNLYELLQEPITEQLGTLSDEELKADEFVAAVYLGRYSHVKKLIADGIQTRAVRGSPDVHSTVFSTAFRAACLQGNVGMIELLLSRNFEYRDTGVLTASEQREILLYASSYGHQAALDFALDTRPITLPKNEYPMHSDTRVLETVIREIQFPQSHKRIAAILGPDRKISNCFTTGWLVRHAYLGNIQMVDYILKNGVNPNYTTPPHFTSPLRSAILRNNEEVIRILIKAGADPNLPAPPVSPLIYAVWLGNISVVKLLLPHVTDINDGNPPPIVLAVFKERMDIFKLLRDHAASLETPNTGGWAMTVAKLHGLSSMIDVLICEGVSEDSTLPQNALSSLPSLFSTLMTEE
ncbi:ankyrin [Xylaria arbuscula]|nr:ankyrin [Xylaria arbuscula]